MYIDSLLINLIIISIVINILKKKLVSNFASSNVKLIHQMVLIN